MTISAATVRAATPWHLDPVTNLVNCQRGDLPGPRKTQCVRGHEYNEAKTFWVRQGKYSVRQCRECAHIRSAAYRARRRLAA